MTRHGQKDSRKRDRCRGDEMGMEEVQGRQRNRKKGINQHRFHYSKVGQAISVYQRNTIPRTVSLHIPTPYLSSAYPLPSRLSLNPDHTASGPRVK